VERVGGQRGWWGRLRPLPRAMIGMMFAPGHRRLAFGVSMVRTYGSSATWWRPATPRSCPATCSASGVRQVEGLNYDAAQVVEIARDGRPVATLHRGFACRPIR
jgi:hypothetical protein